MVDWANSAPVFLTCPTCGKRFAIEDTKTPPFCSQRCQMIDLGKWLDEEIGLPLEEGEAEGS